MTVKEIIYKGPSAYLAWVGQASAITYCDMIKNLMKRATNSRDADEVNFIQKYANSYLADLYVKGNKGILFSNEDMAYNNVTVYFPAIKNKQWVDFSSDLMQKQLNHLDMLSGCLNRLCLHEDAYEMLTLFTSALFYIREIIDISRERALEAEYGPRFERNNRMCAQITDMFGVN